MNTFSLVSDKRTVNAFVIRVGRPNQVMKRGVRREAGRGGGGAGVALCKWVGQPPWAWPSPLLLLLGLHLCAAIERQQRKCSVFFDSVQGFFFQYYYFSFFSFFFCLFSTCNKWIWVKPRTKYVKKHKNKTSQRSTGKKKKKREKKT